jgi:hypothetical protein
VRPEAFGGPIDALIDVDRPPRATEADDEFDQKLESLGRKPLTKPAAISAFHRCCMRANFAFNASAAAMPIKVHKKTVDQTAPRLVPYGLGREQLLVEVALAVAHRAMLPLRTMKKPASYSDIAPTESARTRFLGRKSPSCLLPSRLCDSARIDTVHLGRRRAAHLAGGLLL